MTDSSIENDGSEMSSVSYTYCVIPDDTVFKTYSGDESDEAFVELEGFVCDTSESKLAIITSDSDGQTTPDVIPEHSKLCDSGFTESIVKSLNLQCIECASKYCYDNGTQCTCSSPVHDGFDDYLSDIFMHRLDLEEKYHKPTCLDHQSEVSEESRSVLIQWLTDVHHDLKLCQDTLYLAVNIMDRVLDEVQVARDCLELLGITCLLVASKQNEVFPPELHELLEKCDDVFTRDQMKQLEMIVLIRTKFNLLVPTVQQFYEFYAAFCMNIYAGDNEQTCRLKMARAFGRCVLELSLPEYGFCRFRPSLLALCVWKAAGENLKTFDNNFFPPGLFVEKSQYDLCLSEVHLFIENFQQSYPNMLAVYEKCAKSVYGQQ